VKRVLPLLRPLRSFDLAALLGRRAPSRFSFSCMLVFFFVFVFGAGRGLRNDFPRPFRDEHHLRSLTLGFPLARSFSFAPTIFSIVNVPFWRLFFSIYLTGPPSGQVDPFPAVCSGPPFPFYLPTPGCFFSLKKGPPSSRVLPPFPHGVFADSLSRRLSLGF